MGGTKPRQRADALSEAARDGPRHPGAFCDRPASDLTGGLAFFAGYALFRSVPALVLTVVLGLLWVGKIGVEERLLASAYDGYAAYCRRVRSRLIPFIY